jgi:hypothetical protein
MWVRALRSVSLGLVLVACPVVKETDTDPDTDTDTDTDTGPDTDTDTDTDTDNGSDVDCDANYSTPAVSGECITGPLSCGGEVYATTVGGSTFYDEVQYETSVFSCIGPWGTGISYSAAERVYEIDVPAGKTATVVLDSPCADLALRTIRSGDECLSISTTAANCDGPADVSDPFQTSYVLNSGYRHEILVDGQDGGSGNFKLSVECN